MKRNTLHLAIYEGDIQSINFDAFDDLVEYVCDLHDYDFNCIWLISFNGMYDEIIISEDINIIVGVIEDNVLHLKDNDIHIHEYQSYEDAYRVALSMRETNPKCYNK